MDPESRYYEQSGEIGSIGPVLLLILGGSGAVISGAVYSFATCWISFVYLNIALTLVVGIVVGMLTGQISKLSRIRNKDFVLVMGIILGVLSVYSAWVAWIFSFSGNEVLILSPFRLWSVINWIAEQGAWTVFEMRPKGLALYAIWFSEALAIVVASAVMARKQVQDLIYCEQCNRWVDEAVTISLLEPVVDTEQLKVDLEQGDYSYMDSLKIVDVESDLFTSLSVQQCSSCRTLNLLTVNSVAVTEDKDGKTQLQKRPIVLNLYIDPETYELFKLRITKLNAGEQED